MSARRMEEQEYREYAQDLLLSGIEDGTDPFELMDDLSEIYDGDPLDLL